MVIGLSGYSGKAGGAKSRKAIPKKIAEVFRQFFLIPIPSNPPFFFMRRSYYGKANNIPILAKS
jgi:hypothetical protein